MGVIPGRGRTNDTRAIHFVGRQENLVDDLIHILTLAGESFDEDRIREDVRNTLIAAKDCNVEIVMKDVHTLAGEPQRIARWVELAREAIDEFV